MNCKNSNDIKKMDIQQQQKKLDIKYINDYNICPKCGETHFNCFCCEDPQFCPIHRIDFNNFNN